MLSETETSRIAEAIRAAEQGTSGEIFCIVTEAVSGYRLVPFAWAAAFALLVPWPLVALTTWTATTVYLLQLFSFALVAVILSRPGLRYAIVPGRTKRALVASEAARQFRAKGLDATHGRSAVLIFAARKEGMAAVVADAGIGQKVGPEVWQPVRETVEAGLKDDRIADGLVAGISACGSILAARCPPSAVPRDEIPNRVVEI